MLHGFCPGRNRACPGEPGHEKERDIFYPVAKKEWLGFARSKLVTKKTAPTVPVRPVQPVKSLVIPNYGSCGAVYESTHFRQLWHRHDCKCTSSFDC